ncbi:DUF6680 family protein [Acidiphilium rubrum]|uniref:DUF6680 domain-containing protein n=1 Tax=Acidiphilium rubrum TaxID=526 RepID=A0A8G2FFV4_ACIRU|nr:DUF6680 family protein [Acidiphilium rubrum]SIR57818.1 hypothetical protein SAMN05421828_1633 [Acidiphilium rubrum]
MSPEWIAAIAAIWAAVATTWAALATSMAVIATRKAPVDAAQIAASLQDASERRRQKVWIFATVMQNRSFLAEVDCVKALNLIDAVFSDVPEVRNAWANLYAALNDKRNFPPTGGALPVIDDRRALLLSEMAKDLGLAENFRPDDLARVYLPTALLTEMEVRGMQQKLNHELLSGQLASSKLPPKSS